MSRVTPIATRKNSTISKQVDLSHYLSSTSPESIDMLGTILRLDTHDSLSLPSLIPAALANSSGIPAITEERCFEFLLDTPWVAGKQVPACSRPIGPLKLLFAKHGVFLPTKATSATPASCSPHERTDRAFVVMDYPLQYIPSSTLDCTIAL